MASGSFVGAGVCRAWPGTVLLCVVLAAGGTGAALAGPAPFSAQASGAPPFDAWSHQLLPGVERQNRYRIVDKNGEQVLRVDSQAAASTLLHPLDLDPAIVPRLAWRWRVSNIIDASDFTRKSGDDYAARVYVTFDYPRERLSRGDRWRIGLARRLHGAEIPAAAIVYVWGTAQEVGEHGPNPYTDRVRMIVVESGSQRAGEWVDIERDVAADFEALFGEPAPPINGIAVSADTDNTGESVTAWFGDLRFSP